MKIVEYKDDNGVKHLSLLRNEDLDEMARYGIPNDPPDIFSLDWEEIQKDLHNLLVDKRLITWMDVQASQSGLTSTIVQVLKKRLINLYRHREDSV